MKKQLSKIMEALDHALAARHFQQAERVWSA
jgi:hypothetical protein